MKIAGLTDKGLHRSNNEDSFGYTFKEDGSLLAILCDGIGGSNAGDVASKIAVDTFLEDFKNSEDLLTPQIARDWIKNEVIQDDGSDIENIPFNGRIEKINSVVASFTSSSFALNYNMEFPKPVAFDSRIIPVNDCDIYDCEVKDGNLSRLIITTNKKHSVDIISDWLKGSYQLSKGRNIIKE